MSEQALHKPGITASDRLTMTLVLAVALHTLVILGVGFGTQNEDQEGREPPPFEVTLVNTRSQTEPDKPDYLAQANQEGSGNTDERVRPETVTPAMAQKETPAETSPNPPSKTSPQFRQTRLEMLTQAESEHKVDNELFPSKKNAQESVSAATLISRSKEIASLQMELGESIKAYSERPRRKFITASTKEYKYASYEESWRRKVERIGNLEYPEEAVRRQLSGTLTLTTVIRADGTIKEVTVDRSSGHRVLDAAARRIVHLAAPFAPFPENIRDEADELVITRTWRFMNGKGLSAR